MMKRLLALLLGCMLLCSLATAEQASSYVGVWIENDGYGTLTIRANGTARMDYYDGTVTETTWGLTENGYCFGEGMWYNSPLELLDENTLSVSDGWMIFTREGFLPTTDEALLLGAEPVGEEGEPFLGPWTLVLIEAEGMQMDPALLGMHMTLTFSEDGTVLYDDGLETNAMPWYVENGAAIVDGLPLTINEEGQLIMDDGEAAMIFTQGEAEPAEALSEEELLLALLAMMEEASNDSAAFDPLDTKFVCAQYTVGTVTLDGATLGAEYSVLFHEDGTADLTLGGILMPGVPYSITGDGVYSVGYYGMIYNCTPTDAGFDMDYFGTMTLHLVPEA